MDNLRIQTGVERVGFVAFVSKNVHDLGHVKLLCDRIGSHRLPRFFNQPRFQMRRAAVASSKVPLSDPVPSRTAYSSIASHLWIAALRPPLDGVTWEPRATVLLFAVVCEFLPENPHL